MTAFLAYASAKRCTAEDAILTMPLPPAAKRESTPCVILMGGQSRRFGSNKAFATINGARLIDILIERVASQSQGKIAVSSPSLPEFAGTSRQVLHDQLPGETGPLAGIHAAMKWAADEGHDAVITIPVDTPLLPDNFLKEMVKAGPPAIAKHGDRAHYAHGIWPAKLADTLANAVSRGMRKVQDWATECAAKECEFPEQSDFDPFFNINTQNDLERARPYIKAPS